MGKVALNVDAWVVGSDPAVAVEFQGAATFVKA